MDDAISRQAVIDLLKQMRKDGDMVPWEGKDVFARIRKLPSAQPTQNERVNSNGSLDTVSRQAAIDCLGFTWPEDAIRNLPPAQPEIIRCKDCKHWTNNIGDSKLRDNYCNDEAHGFYYQCSEDDYCSFAERRTDEQTVS